MDIWIKIALLVAVAYIIGIPLGYCVVKKKTKKDIRDFRSGSGGATNVKNLLGVRLGISVAAGDILKGAIPSTVFLCLVEPYHYGLVGVIALSSVLGNIFPAFISPPRFKGGKGVATTCGALIPMLVISLMNYHPPGIFVVLAIILGVWFMFVRMFRHDQNKWMVLASSFLIWTMVVFFGYLDIQTYYTFSVFIFLIAAIVLFAHRRNYQELKEYHEKLAAAKKEPPT